MYTPPTTKRNKRCTTPQFVSPFDNKTLNHKYTYISHKKVPSKKKKKKKVYFIFFSVAFYVHYTLLFCI